MGINFGSHTEYKIQCTRSWSFQLNMKHLFLSKIPRVMLCYCRRPSSSTLGLLNCSFHMGICSYLSLCIITYLLELMDVTNIHRWLLWNTIQLRNNTFILKNMCYIACWVPSGNSRCPKLIIDGCLKQRLGDIKAILWLQWLTVPVPHGIIPVPLHA